MPIKLYRPVTKGRRLSSVQDTSDVTEKHPHKALVLYRKDAAGRSRGKISVRHQGSGHKRRVRIVDYKQADVMDIPARVSSIEYDPHRGARVGVLVYRNGAKRYMLLPEGVRVGDQVVASRTEAEIQRGNRLPLSLIPVGTSVYSVELQPGQGAKLARAAGAHVNFMAIEGEVATLRLPSGETRRVSKECMATIGSVSNSDWHLVRWGKAGRMRHRGIRPTVRGKAMNPVDHPHGGGEGKHPIGMKYAKTPWGKHALGVKTRRKHRYSDRSIVSGRKGQLFKPTS